MQKRMNKPRKIITQIDDLPVICNCDDVGVLLRRPPEQIAKMARDGDIKGAKIGKGWAFRRDDVIDYINNLFLSAGAV